MGSLVLVGTVLGCSEITKIRTDTFETTGFSPMCSKCGRRRGSATYPTRAGETETFMVTLTDSEDGTTSQKLFCSAACVEHFRVNNLDLPPSRPAAGAAAPKGYDGAW